MSSSRSWRRKYTISSKLGNGGNGIVFKVKRKADRKEYAVKELYDKYLYEEGDSERRYRFVTEMRTVSKLCRSIPGIIPIIECSYKEFWYVMPVAEESSQYICKNNFNIKDIVNGVLDLSETLTKLHNLDISHRDIKPSNIYFYKNRFCFSDFGLVYVPDSEEHFTQSDRGLGAIFTIAPEMKRDPKHADGKKADVFSLAKTMWMFLTGDEKGFDGVYDYRDNTHSLRSIEKYKNTHIVELEVLLRRATDNDPNNRPTMVEFQKALNEWLDIYSDYDKSQLSEWNFVKSNAFNNIPESAIWRNAPSIVDVLNIVGASQAYNHMMFSGKGGLDFQYACLAPEPGLIEIHAGGCCHIVKPKTLYFESFSSYWWNYFLLELDDVNPILSHVMGEYETLVEDTPGHYVSAEYEQYKIYDYESGKPLPIGYRLIHRYLKGKMLFVVKNGPYNAINGTYDGRHGYCDHEKFREYIERLIENFKAIKNKVIELDKCKDLTDLELEKRIAKSGAFDKNPFCQVQYKTPNYVGIRDSKDAENFIIEQYSNLSFKEYIDNIPNIESNIKFYLEFLLGDEWYGQLFSEKSKCICTDGYIHEIDLETSDACLFINDRGTAIEFKENCEKCIYDICRAAGFENTEYIGDIFAIHLLKTRTPNHLFTKDEIELLMKEADDRVDNQLVINEDGYPQIIPRGVLGWLYPVRHEVWDAGNNYVGKYSKLESLDDTYLGMLQGWLKYLQTGRSCYIEYIEDDKEEWLLEKIKAFYQT